MFTAESLHAAGVGAVCGDVRAIFELCFGEESFIASFECGVDKRRIEIHGSDERAG